MTDGTWMECHKCKSIMWIPQCLNDAALRSRGVINFYCAYGHGQVYALGQSDEEKLRLERDRLKQQLAARDDEIARQRSMRESTERQLIAQRGVTTRIKNRIGHGVCPCCSRSFENLQRHMKTKHADYSQAAE